MMLILLQAQRWLWFALWVGAEGRLEAGRSDERLIQSFQVWSNQGRDQGGAHRMKAGDRWVCLVVVPSTFTQLMHL